MAWYRQIANAVGQQPGAYIDVSKGSFTTWEANIVRGMYLLVVV
jgi:hypothetical protein